MTEQEFIKAYPEAQRDYESEAFWTNSWDTLEGSIGNSLWRIMKDSVCEYSFRSLKVDGPSYLYPTVDSSRVHKMRESAMKLEAGLEKKLGKPTVLRSQTLLVRPKDPVGNHDPRIQTSDYLEAFFAQWSFDDGKVIIIRVSSELSPGNAINAPVVQQTQKSLSYEFQVTVTRNSIQLPWSFHVGRSYAELKKAEPRVQSGSGGAENVHLYFFKDYEISVKYDALWKFTFVNGIVTEMSYMCMTGLLVGDQSTDIAYNSCKYRAEQLLIDGNISLGKPDSVFNEIVTDYVPHELTNKYERKYLQVAWLTQNGFVYLYFDELGGGKEENVRFSVRVNFLKQR